MATKTSEQTASGAGTGRRRHILIAGAGVGGLTSALALRSVFQENDNDKTVLPPRITVVEARDSLPQLGGAVNITPNGLRYLDALGALARIRARGAGADVRAIDIYARDAPGRIASLPFTDVGGAPLGSPPFMAMRMLRKDMLAGMLEAAQALEGVEVKFGRKVQSIVQTADTVTVSFEDGESQSADMLLGCDGIHSVVRRNLEPARQPQYTGIAVVNGFTDKAAGMWNPEDRDTVFLTAQTGSFFATYYEPSRSKLSVAGVWETQDVGSRDGWTAKGKDQEAIATELKQRFAGGAAKGVDALIDAVSTWMLYPVYKLPPKGIWSAGRIMLLGDAAHAMSPQGESATIAMEDAIVFARCLSRQATGTTSEVFAAYERHRRARIDAAYQEADQRWNGIKDAGWFAHKMQLWIMPMWMWWTQKTRQANYEENLLTAEMYEEEV